MVTLVSGIDGMTTKKRQNEMNIKPSVKHRNVGRCIRFTPFFGRFAAGLIGADPCRANALVICRLIIVAVCMFSLLSGPFRSDCFVVQNIRMIQQYN